MVGVAFENASQQQRQQQQRIPSQQPRPAATEAEDSNDSTTNLLAESSPSSNVARESKGRVRNRKSRVKSKSHSSSKQGESQGPSLLAAEEIEPVGEPMVIKVRLSTLPKDIKMTLQASDRVQDIKRRLEVEQGVASSRITMLYSGRVLNDRTYVMNLGIPKGFLIQAIVN